MSDTHSPDSTYRALHAATGGRLFTVTILDRTRGLARRVCSSHPDIYPVSGTKPIQHNGWTQRVIESAEVFVANTVEEFADYFPDYELIQSLGCESVLNIPIVEDRVVGTINILDKANYFDDQMIRRCISEVDKRHRELLRAFGFSHL